MPVNHKSGLYAGNVQGFHFEARLDVDGDQPQRQLSVTLNNRLPAHWIAELRQLDTRTWEGPVWYRHRKADRLRIGGSRPNRFRVVWQVRLGQEHIVLEFRRHSQHLARIQLNQVSTAMRQVEFELDREQGVAADIHYNTHSHPNRPGNLPEEDLTLASVYERSGVGVSINPAVNAFSAGAGFNQRWNEAELHDAMQANWSRPDGTPWSMWVMFASLFENDPGRVVFGVMFDTIGQFNRNGTAVFMNEIENFYPPNWPDRAATIDRHKFRTLVHEVGHAFNLLHSWQKTLGTPWDPTVIDEPQARSFMNYPGRVSGGEEEYWRRFRYRFSDQELLFMRHAPQEFVAMGGSSWAENHADQLQPDMMEAFAAEVGANDFALTVRFNRDANVFEFMEPVRMEVKLANLSDTVRQVSPALVSDIAHMEVFITRNFGDTKAVRPYTKYCYGANEPLEIAPGKSTYGTVYLSSATNGWLIAEPGRYDIVVGLRGTATQEDRSLPFFVSAETTLFVRPPDPARRLDVQRFAQDYFSEDVGRVLAFGGSLSLNSAEDALRELTQRYGETSAAKQANVAVNLPATRDYKLLRFEDDRPTVDVKARSNSTLTELCEDLKQEGRAFATTLGHVAFKRLTDTLTDRLEEVDDTDQATDMQQNTLDVLQKDKGVSLPVAVVQGIRSRIAAIRSRR